MTPLVARRQLLLGLGLSLAGRAAWAAAPGNAIVWPKLTLVDGSTLGPDAWQDTAAVVVFWATWCGHCRRHNEHIDKLHRLNTDPRLRVLGVAVDAEAPAVRRYLQGNGYGFPVVAGAPGLREQFTTRSMVPITGLVDRRGRLKHVIPGEMSEDDVLGLATLARVPATALVSTGSSPLANRIDHG
jgi:thiol-disulfide isomerase/thioredoxin